MQMSSAATPPPTAFELKVRVVTEEEIVADDGETHSDHGNLKTASMV